MRVLKLFSVAVVAASLVACGGGGGSSGGLDFPSNAVLAEPTLENSEKLEIIAGRNIQDQYTINAVNSSDGPQQNLLISIQNILQIFSDKTKANNYSLNETIDETNPCSGGGTMRVTGSGTASEGGTVTMTASNCVESGVTLSGAMRAVVSGYITSADAFQYMSATFMSDFSLSGNGETVTIHSGSAANMQTLEFDNYGSPISVKVSANGISEINGNLFGTKNVVAYMDLSSNPSMYYTQGDFYFNNLGAYGTYDKTYDMSSTPFVFTSSGVSSGEARFNLANNGKAKMIASGGVIISYVDADADGVYELIEQ